jgi:hypothetical protein
MVSRVAVAMARLPSGGVSGRPTNGGIARLCGGRSRGPVRRLARR